MANEARSEEAQAAGTDIVAFGSIQIRRSPLRHQSGYLQQKAKEGEEEGRREREREAEKERK